MPQLNAKFVENVKPKEKDKRYGDGAGLYLWVRKSGTKQWILRTHIYGKSTDLGLGGFPPLKLRDARIKADAMRLLIRQGLDPRVEKRKEKHEIPTFEVLARTVWNDEKQNFKNEKHIRQWINTLETYVFPELGDVLVNQITPEDCMKVLMPIWLEKKETADRVRMRMSKVMKRAKFLKHRLENPLEDIKEFMPKQNKKVRHFEALPYSDIPQFVRDLRGSDLNPILRLGLEFLIHTCLRPKPVRTAKWSEIDLKVKAWNIPASSMKSGREFSVPLTDRVIEILEEVRAYSGDSEWIFPQARSQSKPLDENALRLAVQDLAYESMNGKQVTAHGFRTTCRGWADERTPFTFEVKEAVLAHVERDKTVAAYSRSQLMEKRREFHETWAAYIDQADNVVHINAGSA